MNNKRVISTLELREFANSVLLLIFFIYLHYYLLFTIYIYIAILSLDFTNVLIFKIKLILTLLPIENYYINNDDNHISSRSNNWNIYYTYNY